MKSRLTADPHLKRIPTVSSSKKLRPRTPRALTPVAFKKPRLTTASTGNIPVVLTSKSLHSASAPIVNKPHVASSSKKRRRSPSIVIVEDSIEEPVVASSKGKGKEEVLSNKQKKAKGKQRAVASVGSTARYRCASPARQLLHQNVRSLLYRFLLL